MTKCEICNRETRAGYLWCDDCVAKWNDTPDTSLFVKWAIDRAREFFLKDTQIVIDKETLIDTLCEEFGITEGKMRRAINKAIKKDKREEQ